MEAFDVSSVYEVDKKKKKQKKIKIPKIKLWKEWRPMDRDTKKRIGYFGVNSAVAGFIFLAAYLNDFHPDLGGMKVAAGIVALVTVIAGNIVVCES